MDSGSQLLLGQQGREETWWMAWPPRMSAPALDLQEELVPRSRKGGRFK